MIKNETSIQFPLLWALILAYRQYMYTIIVTFWIASELLKVIVSSSDIFGNFEKSSENHRKSLEIDRTFFWNPGHDKRKTSHI